MFALIDVNSMYASAEKLFDIKARRAGVCVLSNNDGCCVALDKLAKRKLGGSVKFKPYFQIKEQIEAAGIEVRSSNYELYASISSRFMELLSEYSPKQFVYSIDECFLDLSDLSHADWYALGTQIRRRIWKEMRLPVCVGFGLTPTLAKVANHIAKKNPACKGVFVADLSDKGECLQRLQPEDVWGVGSRIAARLVKLGITNAYELSLQSPKYIQSQFSVVLERTVRELNGEVCLGWESIRSLKKQIFSTRSFGEKVTDLASLEQSVVSHAEKVAKKAREQGSLIKTITVFAHASPFSEAPYSKSLVCPFEQATADSRDIAVMARKAARQIYQSGVQFHKSGVGAIELVDEGSVQADMFASVQRDPRVMDVFDKINRRFGSKAVMLAGQGIEQRWAMQRNMQSPKYTTHWPDIPKIRC